MKKSIITLFVLSSSLLFSQVGINTDKPKATLDVKSSPSDLSKTDGVIAPKLTGNELKAKDELYTNQQQGAIIYATSATTPTTPKTQNVTQEGYYYFDGSKWIRFSSGSSIGNGEDINIYKDNGSLTSNRNADLNGFNLAFTGAGNVGIGNSNPAEKLDVIGDSRVSGKVIIGAGAKNAALGVRNADSSEPIMRLTNAGGSRRLTVTDDGYVGIVINDVTVPTQRLDVDGNIRFRNVPLENTFASTDRIMVLESNGTGKKISAATLKSEIDTNTNIYTNNGTLSANRTVTLGGNNLNFAGTGAVGIGVASPTQKLDINGTARLRDVPNGNADNNQVLLIDGSGVIRKSTLPPSPSFVMYITTKTSVTRNANENIYNLNFPGTPEKIYSEYIEREDSGTFRVKKAGIYTVELWSIYEDISAASSDARLGCRAILNIGGGTGMIGYRDAGGGGNTGITRTKILNVGNRISASTSCNRNGGTYKTSAGSSLFITYMPL